MKGSNVWWPLEGKGETPFHLFPFSPQQIFTETFIFSIDFKVLLYHGSKPLLTHFFPFP
jgi:hypothetical protein